MLYAFSNDPSFPITYFTESLILGPLPCPYKIDSPTMFLDFALEDRKSKDTRGLVNAFGNIKKAIHLRIDMLLNQYGLFYHYSKKKFPAKLEMLDTIGALPTVMIRNLNNERNMLEHEYVIPNEERVAEALDVAQLLYLATEMMLGRTIMEAVVGRRTSPEHTVMRLEPNAGEMRFYELDPGSHVFETNGVEVISRSLRFLQTEVDPGLRVADDPFEIWSLDEKNKDKWLPIVQFMAGIPQHRAPSTVVDSVEISTTVTIPVFQWGRNLSQEFNEVLRKMRLRMENSGDGAASPPSMSSAENSPGESP